MDAPELVNATDGPDERDSGVPQMTYRRIHEGHRVVTRCPSVFLNGIRSALGDGSNFSCEVRGFLLDAFAEKQAGHADNFDRCAGFLFSFLDGSADS